MDVFYINLASAVERRETYLKNFAACEFSPAWRLHRFDGITPAHDIALKMTGATTAVHRAAYLSHLECVKFSREFEGHALISEDDTQFCRATESWVDRVLGGLDPNSWDVLFLDLCFSNAVDLPQLLKTRRKCMNKGVVEIVSLKAFPIAYAGAGSYIINKQSKDKFVRLMERAQIDHPYDLELRSIVRHGLLAGSYTFPFLATVSETGDTSQVQLDDTKTQEMLWNSFRRFIWIGAESGSGMRDRLNGMEFDFIDDEVATLNAILTPLLSIQMVW